MPETIDCICALTGIEHDGAASVAKTDAALGVTKTFLPRTTQPMAHLAGADVDHPEIAAARAGRAAFMEIGFKGAEEPADPEPTPEQRTTAD